MRKIKYKIYYRQSKRHNYACWEVTELKFTEDGVEAYIKDDDSPYYVGEDCELVQFTGLSDKQGKEIWEGDIVDGQASMSNFPSRYGIVRWVDAGLRFNWLFDGKEKEHYWNVIGENTTLLEVIGNIYENKDLLK